MVVVVLIEVVVYILTVSMDSMEQAVKSNGHIPSPVDQVAQEKLLSLLVGEYTSRLQ